VKGHSPVDIAVRVNAALQARTQQFVLAITEKVTLFEI
jgi:hypothetical protein